MLRGHGGRQTVTNSEAASFSQSDTNPFRYKTAAAQTYYADGYGKCYTALENDGCYFHLTYVHESPALLC